ncbi:MAG: prepilin peptidase [Candidatus Tumulicola sp.]
MPLPIAFALAACFAAVYGDVRDRRIPNWLTGSLAVAAVIVHGFSGIRSAAISLAVMTVLTLLGTLVHSRGGIGGGDVKLGIAASGMLSYPLCVPFLLYTMVGGGVLALALILVRGNARNAFSRAVLLTIGGPPAAGSGKTQTMPYAIAFAFGAVLVALSQSVAPFLRIML